MTKKITILIGVSLSLFALLVTEFILFLCLEIPIEKEIVYHKSDNTVLEQIIDSPVPKENTRAGITTSFLNVDKSNIGDLSKYSKIEHLTINNVEEKEIQDIEGLQVYSLSLKNVIDFDFSKLDTSRISSITLENSTVKDINDIKQMTRLKSVDLNSLQIDDFDFLSDFDALWSLHITNCKVNDFTAIGKIKRINNLSIRKCGLANASFLKDTNIECLYINENRLTDISFIDKMTKLSSLDASRNLITGNVILNDMPELKWVDLSFNEIDNIVCDVSSLYSLDLSYNSIDEISDELLDKFEHITDKDAIITVNLFGNILDDCSNLNKFEFIKFIDEKEVSFSCKQYVDYTRTIKDIVEKYVDKDWSDIKKAVAIFDFISENTEYDRELPDNDPFPYKHISHTEYGTLINKKAVCDGFAYAYRDILKYLGIESYIYHGDMISTTDNAAHAWNLVKIDGLYYHCDLTAEISIAKYVDDIRNFGQSDGDVLEKSYFLLDKEAPKCDKNINKDLVNEIVSETRRYAGIEVDDNEEQGIVY